MNQEIINNEYKKLLEKLKKQNENLQTQIKEYQKELNYLIEKQNENN